MQSTRQPRCEYQGCQSIAESKRAHLNSMRYYCRFHSTNHLDLPVNHMVATNGKIWLIKNEIKKFKSELAEYESVMVDYTNSIISRLQQNLQSAVNAINVLGNNCDEIMKHNPFQDNPQKDSIIKMFFNLSEDNLADSLIKLPDFSIDLLLEQALIIPEYPFLIKALKKLPLNPKKCDAEKITISNVESEGVSQRFFPN